VARGGIIHEVDLMKALDEGIIAGAGIDVFREEPHNSKDPKNPFAAYNDNVLTTPHMAMATTEAVYRIGQLVKDNVDDVMSGKRPRRNIVNAL
jgi:lactate dehydrogenase-like 2-hydroxyacid dehydrogenase